MSNNIPPVTILICAFSTLYYIIRTLKKINFKAPQLQTSKKSKIFNCSDMIKWAKILKARFR